MAKKTENIVLLLKTTPTFLAQYLLPLFLYFKNNIQEAELPFEETELCSLIQELSLPPILFLEGFILWLALFSTKEFLKDTLTYFSHLFVLAGISFIVLHGLPDVESLKQVFDEQQISQIEQNMFIYFPIVPLLGIWVAGKLSNKIKGVFIPKKAKH